MNTLLSITWARTKDQNTPFNAMNGEVHTFYTCDRISAFSLAFELKELGYKFVTVRDALGNIVDLDKGVCGITLYDSRCLIRK